VEQSALFSGDFEDLAPALAAIEAAYPTSPKSAAANSRSIRISQ